MGQKRIIVFGAGGFIGTYLIDELLALGHEITAIDISDVGRGYYEKKGVAYVNVDITKKSDFEILANESFDAVIHLAACQPANVSEQDYDPTAYIQVNVIGTLNILEFCRQTHSGKFILATSHRNTQGLWAADKAIKESDGRGVKYTGEYAMFSIAESAAQDCVDHYRAQHGLSTIIFRLPPVYGYGPHTEIFKEGKPIKTGFQVFIDNARSCRPLEVWGDGNVGRDIIYIKDVVAAFVKALDKQDASGLFNITSGRYLTLREQADSIAKVFWGSSGPPKVVVKADKPNGIDSFLYDISKARRELDWAPKYSFEDMLIDYEKESIARNYEYLVEKRKSMLGKD